MAPRPLCFLKIGKRELGPDQARDREFLSEAGGRIGLRERVKKKSNILISEGVSRQNKAYELRSKVLVILEKLNGKN